ncbi:MAG: 1,2-phenylacetyl-CoA epoxidase subunit PaaD [Bacteroidota bacterium]
MVSKSDTNVPGLNTGQLPVDVAESSLISRALPAKDEIMEWLHAVKDPEIPVLSLVDLGVITDIRISESGRVEVEMTPTFSGCPAMDVMRQGVEQELSAHGIADYKVNISFEKPWSSDKITARGREALKRFGLAPPAYTHGQTDIDLIEQAICPRCNSHDTLIKSIFGPALCRSLHYCNTCKQGFEQFKPI